MWQSACGVVPVAAIYSAGIIAWRMHTGATIEGPTAVTNYVEEYTSHPTILGNSSVTMVESDAFYDT